LGSLCLGWRSVGGRRSLRAGDRGFGSDLFHHGDFRDFWTDDDVVVSADDVLGLASADDVVNAVLDLVTFESASASGSSFLILIGCVCA